MNESCEENACSQNAELQLLRHFIPNSRAWLFFIVDSELPGNLGLSLSYKSRSRRASTCSPSPEKAQGYYSLGRQSVLGLLTLWVHTVELMSRGVTGGAR